MSESGLFPQLRQLGRRGRRPLIAAGTAVLLLAASTGAATAAATPTHPAAAIGEAAASTPPGTVDQVSQAAQTATAAYWTPQNLATAVPDTGSKPLDAPTDPGAPPGTPTANTFDGVPTTGALFYTTGTQRHYCSASVVDSFTLNMVLTAAHCVNGGASGTGYRQNVAYVPGYHDGQRPYGTWVVSSMLVANGWIQSSDQNLDFAFLTVTPAAGSSQQVQQVTGGNLLGIDLGYNHHVEVIGYPGRLDEPIECATVSFEAMPDQLQFNCHGYTGGTSGCPWLIHYDPDTGSGIVIGVIGGYQEGGDYEYTSYSSYFGLPTLNLFLQAEQAQLPQSPAPAAGHTAQR